MANQPPVRPWFRLSSLRGITPAPPTAPAPETRPTAPAPAPAPTQPETRPSVALPTFRTTSAPSSPQPRPPPQPETRPPVALPTFRTTSVPSSPQTRAPPPVEEPVAPPPPQVERTSVPPSPVRRVRSPDQKGTISEPTSVPSDMNGRARSPKLIRQAVQAIMGESPKGKPTAPPPSPLVLPPAQTMKTRSETEEAEAEQKRVLVQKTVDKPKQRVTGEKPSMLHHEKHMKEVKKAEEAGMRVITIAGENRGAFMEVIQSPDKHKKKGNGEKEGKKEGSESEKSSEEGEGKKKEKKGHKGKGSRAFPMAAFLNSNVQSVNNSLLYNSSCSQHDPGVRFHLSKKPLGEGYHIKEEKN